MNVGRVAALFSVLAFAVSGCARSVAGDKTLECFAWEYDEQKIEALSHEMLRAALNDERFTFTFNVKDAVLAYSPTPIVLFLPWGGRAQERNFSILIFTVRSDEFSSARSAIKGVLKTIAPTHSECKEVKGMTQPIVSY